MQDSLQIGLVQYSPIWEDKEANKKKLRDLVSGLQSVPDILVFPEMTLTGFSMHPDKLAEERNGGTEVFFRELARENSCAVIFGKIGKSADQYFNELIWMRPDGEIVAVYQKIHLFSFADEHLHYTSGESLKTVDFKGFKFALSICFDLRFPELFRMCTKTGTDVIINIANWPERRAGHWNALLKARAIENQSFVIAVNRSGSDPFVSYRGDSSAYDPLGEILINSTSEDVIEVVGIQKETVTSVREKFPFIKEMKLV